MPNRAAFFCFASALLTLYAFRKLRHKAYFYAALTIAAFFLISVITPAQIIVFSLANGVSFVSAREIAPPISGVPLFLYELLFSLLFIPGIFGLTLNITGVSPKSRLRFAAPLYCAALIFLFAICFFAPAEYELESIARTKNGSGAADYGKAVELEIIPAGRTRYTRPVFMLTNKETISAGEYCALALKTQSRVTHIGSATAGAFSLSLERTLVNGWKYSMSVEKVTDPAGTCHEGKGLFPESPFYCVTTAEKIAEEDTQLEAAIAAAGK